MGKIDLSINKVGLEHNIQKAKENNVIIPTIAQMQHPETIPEKIQAKLKNVGLWDVNPLNLFRITWKNEAKESGGLFQEVPNYVEIPSELSGVPCRIIAMAAFAGERHSCPCAERERLRRGVGGEPRRGRESALARLRGRVHCDGEWRGRAARARERRGGRRCDSGL